MATIHSALATVKGQCAKLMSEAMVRDACAAAGHRWRRRKLAPATTVHLLLSRLLAHVAMVGLDRVAKVGVSTAAVCKARMRLPLAVWMALAELSGRNLTSSSSSSYKGHRVYLVDGTTFTAPDTPALARRYGKASNQRHALPGLPVPKLLALMDLATGAIAKVIDLPHARGEQTVLARVPRFVSPGDLLLGDRGLISFAHVAVMLDAGVHCLMRLPRCMVVHGRGGGAKRRVGRLGRQDVLVRWGRPAQYKLSWMSRRSWRRLPASLVLRQVAFRLYRAGFRPRWAWVVTTLNGPRRYPAQSLAELYGKRWAVEAAFRHMKRTTGMTRLTARTVDGVKKQILAFVMLYNLVRRLMSEAASHQGVAPDRVSFADAMVARCYTWRRASRCRRSTSTRGGSGRANPGHANTAGTSTRP